MLTYTYSFSQRFHWYDREVFYRTHYSSGADGEESRSADATAECRKNVDDVIIQLVNEDVPKMIDLKAEKFDNELDGALAELRSEWTTSLKAEVRACATEFIWSDIKDTAKLENKLAGVDARLSLWIKQFRDSEQRVAAEREESAQRVAAVEKECRDLRKEVTELKVVVSKLLERYSAMRDGASTWLRSMAGPEDESHTSKVQLEAEGNLSSLWLAPRRGRYGPSYVSG